MFSLSHGFKQLREIIIEKKSCRKYTILYFDGKDMLKILNRESYGLIIAFFSFFNILFVYRFLSGS